MVSNKKIDRANNGPGFFEITLGVALSIALGVLLSAVYLILKPVTTKAELPESPDKSVVYYIEGSTNSSKARQWMRKRQMLADGTAVDVVLVEEELNAWVSNIAPEKGAPVETVTPEKINFRIRDGVMQIGVQNKLNAAGFTRELVVQTRGTFVPGASGFVFTADELFIGSLPTHTVPGLKDFIIQRILANQPIPEDMVASWNKLKTVAVEGNTLHLALP